MSGVAFSLWQEETKDASSGWIVLHPDHAPMSQGDVAANDQPETNTLAGELLPGFHLVVLLEDQFLVLVRDSRSSIRHPDERVAVRRV